MSAIVKEAQYGLKPESVKVKRYTRVLPSLGNNPSSGYAFGDTVTFYLPCGLTNQVLDGSTATLRFQAGINVAAAGGNVAANAQFVGWDYTASSLIRRIDIYGSGGALISSVDRYNVLMNCLYDVSHSASELCGLSPLLGCNERLYGTDADGSGTVNTTIITNEQSRRSKAMKNTAQVNQNANTTFTFTFSIPLISPLTSGCDKYIPIYALNDDIRIEIVLDTQVNSVVIPTVANSTVTLPYAMLNPSIIVDYLEIEDGAMNQIKSLYSGRDLVLHAEDWHTYETTVADATTGQWNTILPCKAMSAKMALFTWRRLGTTGVQAGYALSSRTNPFTTAGSTFNLNVGGNRVPQRPITTMTTNGITEYFIELKKALHALNHVEFSGNMCTSAYTSSSDVAVGDNPNARSFLAGINLDTLRGQSDVLLSGTDLSKVTTYIEGNYAGAITGAQTLNTFVKHDTLLVVSPDGSLTSRW